jgi:branched-chain amino acid aminotransferase
VNSFLAQHTAELAGFDTGIMLDQSGRLAEASTSNLFFLQGDTLTTPSLTPEIFPGITRNVIIEIANALELKVVERDVYPSEIASFEAAFLCATLIEIRPLESIGDHVFQSQDHPVFLEILKRFRELVHQ